MRNATLGTLAQPVNEQLRRSPRVVRVVPLTLSLDDSISLQVRSAVINAHGALIISPEPIAEKTPVTLFNQNTGACVKGSVVWTDRTPSPLHSRSSAQFKLGIEFREQAAEFWGSDYVQTLPHTGRDFTGTLNRDHRYTFLTSDGEKFAAVAGPGKIGEARLPQAADRAA